MSVCVYLSDSQSHFTLFVFDTTYVDTMQRLQGAYYRAPSFPSTTIHRGVWGSRTTGRKNVFAGVVVAAVDDWRVRFCNPRRILGVEKQTATDRAIAG